MSATKIVATIGPSCDTAPKISRLLKAGVNVFRFNLKHNTQKWHSVRIGRVREVSRQMAMPVAILLDLQGPEIRIGTFKEGKLLLRENDKVFFVLQSQSLTRQSRVQRTNKPRKEIVLNNLKLLESLKKGHELTIDDGKFRFRVLRKKILEVEAKVLEGGVLKEKKGVNIPNLELDLPTLVEKDFADLSLAARHEVDFLALSFVRQANDIKILREEINKRQIKAQIIAKIETGLALKNFSEILAETDGVMVARGDLGVELPIEQVPFYQKQIIKECLAVGKPVITATQMLESMIDNPVPTRAEVSDVANAVYDYTDAVMLSAETAAGLFPEKAVLMMKKISRFIEEKNPSPERINYTVKHQTSVMTLAANDLLQNDFCQREKIKALVALTETGMTARMLSRLRPKLPIVALTRNAGVRDQLLLSWGVYPILLPSPESFYDKKDHLHIQEFVKIIKKQGWVKTGEKIILVYSEDWGTPGKTSIIRIQEVN
ncbi:pyruvate kinase [Candidatus Microgenomates bacterium]|nr:pyruvate kinase [Candidatus Microgenomates bacterium]